MSKFVLGSIILCLVLIVGLASCRKTSASPPIVEGDKEFKIGNKYYFGKGVDADPIEAARWYKIAAEKGHADGQYNLALCYYDGDGVLQNRTEAVRWYMSAAEKGHAEAQCNLGVCYLKGTGVMLNIPKAYFWFLLSSAKGNEGAKYNMSLVEKILTADQQEEIQDEATRWQKP